MLNILFIIMGFELSYAGGGSSIYEVPELVTIDQENTYFVSFDINVFLYDYFYVKGSVKIPIFAFENDTFWPAALSSYAEVGIFLDKLSIGWRHFCTHPVTPYFGSIGLSKFNDEHGNEFFIRFQTDKIKVF